MKSFRLLLITMFCLNAWFAGAKESIGILSLDIKGLNMDAAVATNIARNELEKLGKYEILDKYDMEYALKKENITMTDCFGRQCLLEAGRRLKADKMLTGSIELYGNTISLNLRLLDVTTGTIEKAIVQEFLDLKNQIPVMIGMTVKKMFDQTIDNELFTKLTKKFDYENLVNNPDVEKLNLSGPRMGFAVFTGRIASILSAKQLEGGFNMSPVMFQFGYQYEVKYLNEGNIQALFEFIPMITGLDQGKFIPSLSILNGIRSNIGGWELAFGPNVRLATQIEGYYDNQNKWRIDASNPDIPRETRADSRGTTQLASAFVIAIGKSFRSGKLNIPLNAYMVPGRNGIGHQFGISFGFNAR